MRFFIFLVLFPALAFTAERPRIPEPSEDRVLTKGKSAKEYFEARKQNTACWNDWKATFQKYRALKSELYALIVKGTPASTCDKKENEMLQMRSHLLDITEMCGPCDTQEVSKVTVVGPENVEYWSVTDGSCYFPSSSPELARENFENAEKFLRNTKGYARHRGGFDSILEFVPIDRLSGAVLPQVENAELIKGLDTFITVRGKAGLSFNYTFENHGERIEQGDRKEYVLRFNAFERPEGLKIDVYDTTIAGTKRSILMNRTLTRVIGMWYFNTDGYYRYFTAADFESPVFGLGTSTARRTLLDTVLNFSERGFIPD